MSDEFKQNFKQYAFGSLSDEALDKTIASEAASRKLMLIICQQLKTIQLVQNTI